MLANFLGSVVMPSRSLFFIIVLGFFSAFFPNFSFGQNVLRSSVSAELVDGLHVKYLEYIASHMNMEIEIIPMPFARRLRELRLGHLDLLIGLQRVNDKQDEVVYIQPSYETLRHSFFVKKENTHQLQGFADLKELTIGVSRHAKYLERFNQEPGLMMVPVASLRQKIELLMKGKINTFIHFQESVLPLISQMGLQNDIVLADYQPIEVNQYYLTISQNSPLFAKKYLFEAIVKEAVANQEFMAIRQKHYASALDFD